MSCVAWSNQTPIGTASNFLQCKWVSCSKSYWQGCDLGWYKHMGAPCFPQPNLWLARCASMLWAACEMAQMVSTATQPRYATAVFHSNQPETFPLSAGVSRPYLPSAPNKATETVIFCFGKMFARAAAAPGGSSSTRRKQQHQEEAAAAGDSNSSRRQQQQRQQEAAAAAGSSSSRRRKQQQQEEEAAAAGGGSSSSRRKQQQQEEEAAAAAGKQQQQQEAAAGKQQQASNRQEAAGKQ